MDLLRARTNSEENDMDEPLNIAQIAINANRDIVEVVTNHCQGDIPLTLYVLTNSIAILANAIHRHPDNVELREAGFITEKIVSFVSRFIPACVREDTTEIGKLIEEIFGGTVTVIKDEAELRQFKNLH